MKLNNYIRDTFIRAVTNDVPDVVFPTAQVIQAALLEKMNPKLRAVWEDETLRKYITKGYCEYACDYNHSLRYVFYGNLDDKDVIGDLIEAKKVRTEAINKVRQLANACTTLKQLKDQLPELEKYMPDEQGRATKNVPMVIGVIEDLKKAGFPK